MAGNSETFKSRQKINEANIKQYQSWSVGINYVVQQFDDTVARLQEQLDAANMSIDALITRLDTAEKVIHDISAELARAEFNYVRLDSNSLVAYSAPTYYYTYPCGVFSNIFNEDNIVYVYSDTTVKGVWFDDDQFTYIGGKSTGNTQYYLPFGVFSGSNAGSMHIIKTFNASKIKKDVNLYFSFKNRFESSKLDNITVYDAENNKIPAAKFTLKISHSNVVPKSLETVNQSKLSEVMIQNSMQVTSETMMTSKVAHTYKGKAIGQYSATKTVASIANHNTHNDLNTTN